MIYYIWLIFMVNVGKYTSPMDPMGLQCTFMTSGNIIVKL